MAIMVTQLGVEPGDHVLEIGAGTGYNAAILAHIAGPTGHVISVDILPDVVEQATANLEAAELIGVAPIDVRVGDGWLGAPDGAPFDKIEATVGIWDLSRHWMTQLDRGGVIVVPFWLRCGMQASVAFRRAGDHLIGGELQRCGFMRLRGPHAGPEAYVNVDRWTACLEGPTEREIAVLSHLLRQPARVIPAPALDDGWFMRIAFEERGAIRLFALEDWRHEACGLFDGSATGLALVDGTTILSYGDPGCLRRLIDRLRDHAPMDMSALRIEAAPIDEPVEADTDLAVMRRDFWYRIRAAA